ncbi:hypothetical protein Tco_0564855 [Tanacetum coccineum]
MKELEGEWIMKKEMRMISKDGTISGFPRYTSSKEEKDEEEKKEASEMGSNSEPPGYAAINDDVESGLSNDENPDIAAIIVQQLQTILPQIVTQVTNNVNNANGGNGGNNGCSYKTFLACNPRDYDGEGGAVALTRWIEKMESERGHEAAIGMSWVDFKALLVEEFCPSNEIEKLESKFWNHTMIEANHAGYTDRFHELAKLVPHLSAILKAGILTDEAAPCGTLTKSSEKRKELEETSKQ